MTYDLGNGGTDKKTGGEAGGGKMKDAEILIGSDEIRNECIRETSQGERVWTCADDR